MMTVLGLPLSMFLVFMATILAGSLGAIHYVIVHVILAKPFPDEAAAIRERDPTERTASPGHSGNPSSRRPR